MLINNEEISPFSYETICRFNAQKNNPTLIICQLHLQTEVGIYMIQRFSSFKLGQQKGNYASFQQNTYILIFSCDRNCVAMYSCTYIHIYIYIYIYVIGFIQTIYSYHYQVILQNNRYYEILLAFFISHVNVLALIIKMLLLYSINCDLIYQTRRPRPH